MRRRIPAIKIGKTQLFTGLAAAFLALSTSLVLAQDDNEIDEADIARADGAIIASSIRIEGAERFEGLPIIECGVEDPVGEGEAVIEALLAEIESVGN